jgi:hypothetical protein
VEETFSAGVARFEIGAGFTASWTGLAVSMVFRESLATVLNTCLFLQKIFLTTRRTFFCAATFGTVSRTCHTLGVVQDKRVFRTGRQTGEVVQDATVGTQQTVALTWTGTRLARLVAMFARPCCLV